MIDGFLSNVENTLTVPKTDAWDNFQIQKTYKSVDLTVLFLQYIEENHKNR